MILIADGGSTKIDWAVSTDKKFRIQSQGTNPYALNIHDITRIYKTELLPAIKHLPAVKEIFFYGAGCENAEGNSRIKSALQEVFPQSVVFVGSDMLGAARAIHGDNKGMAAILGTGSNTCFFDGEKTHIRIPSLGYMLGDQGSGGHIGKRVIQAYFLKEMNASLSDKFTNTYKLSLAELLNKVYVQKAPNTFIAGFAKFAHTHRHEPEIKMLLTEVFDAFFRATVLKYPESKQYPLGLVGSIANYFEDEITTIAKAHNVLIRNIIQRPIDGLLQYHTKGFTS